MKKSSRFTPLWIAMGVVMGILIGTFYANHFSGNRLNIINTSGNKLNNLLHIIDDQYVDTVNVNDLVEKAMPQILSELDPHSVYITASPCIECAKLIIQAGIRRVVYGENYRLTDGIDLLRRAGIEVILMEINRKS